jgi:hypothetical protein
MEGSDTTNDNELSRNVWLRRRCWWRQENTITALLLLLLIVFAVFSGICLLVFSYAVLMSGN